MTMTTCHPKFTAKQRMIVHAVLTTKLAKAKAGTTTYASTMPPSISALHRGRCLMYTWIWRHLPGALATQARCRCCCSSLAVSALLLFIVFPWIEPHLPINHVTVNGQ